MAAPLSVERTAIPLENVKPWEGGGELGSPPLFHLVLEQCLLPPSECNWPLVNKDFVLEGKLREQKECL